MEQAPPAYHSPFFYRFAWPNFYPDNYDHRPSVNDPVVIDYQYEGTTSLLSETVVIIMFLIISQLMVPSIAVFIVRLWPSLREKSVRVMLMLGWYAVMAWMVIGARGQLEDAWMRGFQRGWVESGGVEEDLRKWKMQQDGRGR